MKKPNEWDDMLEMIPEGKRDRIWRVKFATFPFMDIADTFAIDIKAPTSELALIQVSQTWLHVKSQPIKQIEVFLIDEIKYESIKYIGEAREAPVVFETCPNCANDVSMFWNVDTDGYKAYCPYCGERLMLCDECRHSEKDVCNYSTETDSCRHNRR